MKHILSVVAIMMLILTSCSKESLPRGLYYSDTKDGVLYLKLEKRNDCKMFFHGAMECDGFYEVQGYELILVGHASTEVNGKSCSWWFGGTLGNGLIEGDSFKIQAQRLYSSTPEYYHITFRKLD